MVKEKVHASLVSPSSLLSTSFLPPPSFPTLLTSFQGKSVIAIIGGDQLAASLSFSSRLVSLGFPRVCVLHGGIQVMKAAGLVSVPDI